MRCSTVLSIAALLLILPASSEAIEQQLEINWCWAASIQDVVAEAGVQQSQPQISQRLPGWQKDRPAYIGEVVGILQSYGFRAQRAGSPGSPQQLYGTLSSGWKLIAFVSPQGGNVGHYIVLEGIDPASGGIVVADPWTGQTYLNSLNDLYNGWHWLDSVVVGTPGP